MATILHQLSLDVPHTNNPRIFRIFDTSVYADFNLLPAKCGTLEITPPGFSVPLLNIDVDPQFNLVLTACDLGLQTTGCTEVSNVLPDGIYIIRYSVSPNDKVFVEYYHLRVTQFVNRYYQMLCTLEMAACEPDKDVKEQLEELRLIKSFIDAAKVKVEECNDPKNGMELLMYAQRRLMKLDGMIC